MLLVMLEGTILVLMERLGESMILMMTEKFRSPTFLFALHAAAAFAQRSKTYTSLFQKPSLS